MGYKIDTFDVFCLGITIVIGGQYFAWNFALTAGVGSTFVALMLVGIAYVCLSFSMAEVASTFPISGGAFGLARVTLGFFPGYVIGICEMMEYISYVSASVLCLAPMIGEVWPLAMDYLPAVWAGFYVISCLIYTFSGRFFWYLNIFLAVVSIVCLFIYCFGALLYTDFGANGLSGGHGDFNTKWVIGGMGELLRVLPLALWFFVGVETITMTGEDVRDYKTNIPYGIIYCVLFLFVTANFVFWTYVSIPHPDEPRESNLMPFNVVMQPLFNIDHATATLFSIPATFATSFGFIYSYGRVILALAEAKLMPRFLTIKTKDQEVPYVAIIVGSIIGYGMCLICYFIPEFSAHVFNICVCNACMGYCSQMYGYITLHVSFSEIPRNFKSPLGLTGAVGSMIIWSLVILSIAFFQDGNYVSIIGFIVCVSIPCIPYMILYRGNQGFSASELKILGKLHRANFKRELGERLHRKGKSTRDEDAAEREMKEMASKLSANEYYMLYGKSRDGDTAVVPLQDGLKKPKLDIAK